MPASYSYIHERERLTALVSGRHRADHAPCFPAQRGDVGGDGADVIGRFRLPRYRGQVVGWESWAKMIPTLIGNIANTPRIGS